jgi:iron-sulfur cluster assembly protein
MTPAVLTLTANAAEQIKTLLAQAPDDQTVLGLRIGVSAGGCSGMSYYMEYATEQQPMEEVIDDKGVKIFIDPKAMMYLVGTEMDYNEDEFNAGFVFNNPNEAGRCGCGKSFKV